MSHASDGSVESAEYKDIQDRLNAVELVKQETAEALRAKEQRAAKQNSASRNGESSSLESSSTSETRVVADNDNTNATSQNAPRQTTTQVTSGEEPSLQTASAPLPASAAPETSLAYELTGEALEQHIADLRRQVVRVVKKPGAPLQSAPFHTATTIRPLQPGAEILVVITTPYWFGVETHEGEHGWIRRDELELAP